MLILTRKTNEAIKISDNIEVIVLSIKNGHVKLGIGAPKTVPVHREEVYRKIISEENFKNSDAVNFDPKTDKA